jgi:O-antigen ligase
LSDTTVVQFSVAEESAARSRIAAVLNHAVFGSLILLIVGSAIPYGTAEPFWKAAFVSATFAICIVAILEGMLSGEVSIGGSTGILLSMLTMCGFALLQTVTIRAGNPDPAVSALGPWNAISADPYQTRFVVLQLLALTTCLALLYRYCRTELRINVLIHAIIAVAVASALFGILRQTVQHQPGFVLPRTMPGSGYGQFINKNHFGYLMEMALGLGLGMGVVNGLKRERVIVYLALLLPIWTGLVLSLSRGGILAMVAQVVVASILLTSQPLDSKRVGTQKSRLVRMALLVILVVIILAGTVWVGGDRLVSSFGAASTEFNPDPDRLRVGVTRNEIWRASWKMFAAHPMLGVGLGGYWIAITAYHDASGTMTPQQAHNDYLELLTSGGLVGFTIGIWFAVSLFRRARKNLFARDRFQQAVCFAALLGITGVAVHSLVDFGLHLLVNALVFIALVMLATTKIKA